MKAAQPDDFERLSRHSVHSVDNFVRNRGRNDRKRLLRLAMRAIARIPSKAKVPMKSMT
jgi:hypothetical protein